MKNDNLTDAQRVFIHAVMFKEGIVPMENPSMDVRVALAGLPPDEARKLKRRFRKLWRKLYRARAAGNPIAANAIKSQYMSKDVPPTRQQKLRRKRAVHDHFVRERVAPMLRQFQTISNTDDKE